jgi:opacity protein-like surface antigen
MKTLLSTITLSMIFATISFADNIDGTLAVDNYNNQAKESVDHFKAEYTPDNSTAQKSDEPATTVPASATAYNATFLEGPFVGIELSSILSADADGRDSNGVAYGLRFGAQNLEWRTMAVLQKYSNSDGFNDYLKGEVDLDYFFLGTDNLVVENYAIRPYFGLNLGALSMDTETKNVKTVTYGAQVGATMSLTNQIDLDLGYKYNATTSNRVDSISGISAGLHYKY